MPPFDSMRKIRATIFNTITYILLVAHHQLISFSVKLILERINVSNINDLDLDRLLAKFSYLKINLNFFGFISKIRGKVAYYIFKGEKTRKCDEYYYKL